MTASPPLSSHAPPPIVTTSHVSSLPAMNRIAFPLLLLAALAAAGPARRRHHSERIQAAERAGGMDSGESGEGMSNHTAYSIAKEINFLIQDHTIEILFKNYSATVNKTVEANPNVTDIVKSLTAAKKKVIQDVQKNIPKLANITKSVEDGMKEYAKIMIENLAEKNLHAEMDRFFKTELGSKMKNNSIIYVNTLLTESVKNKFETTISTYVKNQMAKATKNKQTVYAAEWKYRTAEGSYAANHLPYDFVNYIEANYKGVQVVVADSGEDYNGGSWEEDY